MTKKSSSPKHPTLRELNDRVLQSVTGGGLASIPVGTAGVIDPQKALSMGQPVKDW